MDFQFSSIATLRTPFTQKFAIPRQPNLVPEAVGELVFHREFNDPNFLRQLEGFSHLWLIFVFHGHSHQNWTATVQPPRLGGKERVGVFASRAPFRPNPVGISVVRNLGSTVENKQLILRLGGVDMLDQTPVLDIKPYIPYADSIPEASSGFAKESPGHDKELIFSESALEQLAVAENSRPGIEALIRSILTQDPRPAWRAQEQDEKQYGMSLWDINIKWKMEQERVVVNAIEQETE